MRFVKNDIRKADLKCDIIRISKYFANKKALVGKLKIKLSCKCLIFIYLYIGP